MIRLEQGGEGSLFLEVRIAVSFECPPKSDLVHTEPFEDEIHPRLRFAHRGLVAMANSGTKNSNDSQFFITLGICYCYLSPFYFSPAEPIIFRSGR